MKIRAKEQEYWSLSDLYAFFLARYGVDERGKDIEPGIQGVSDIQADLQISTYYPTEDFCGYKFVFTDGQTSKYGVLTPSGTFFYGHRVNELEEHGKRITLTKFAYDMVHEKDGRIVITNLDWMQEYPGYEKMEIGDVKKYELAENL